MSVKRVHLTVIASNEPSWMPRADVPATRGDCPVVRPCVHVRCREHLWTMLGGEDGVRAGRPGLSRVPRNAAGLTLSVLGDNGGERAGTTLEARWLESPMPPSCALDEASRGPLSNEQVGEAIGRHRTLVAQVNKDALAHAIEEGKARGIAPADLLDALMGMGLSG